MVSFKLADFQCMHGRIILRGGWLTLAVLISRCLLSGDSHSLSPLYFALSIPLSVCRLASQENTTKSLSLLSFRAEGHAFKVDCIQPADETDDIPIPRGLWPSVAVALVIHPLCLEMCWDQWFG